MIFSDHEENTTVPDVEYEPEEDIIEEEPVDDSDDDADFRVSHAKKRKPRVRAPRPSRAKKVLTPSITMVCLFNIMFMIDLLLCFTEYCQCYRPCPATRQTLLSIYIRQ